MSLYNDVVTSLKEDKSVREFYRFQGPRNVEHLNIQTSKVNEEDDNYIYFSGSLDHHKYFTIKRIRQIINKQVLVEKPYLISGRVLRDNESYNLIKELVINSEKLRNLYSVKLVADKNLSYLVKENSFFQDQKKGKTIERVDRKVYGGGYGVATEWRELFTLLTFFNAYQRIDRYDILTLLSNMRKTGRVNQKDNITFLLSENAYYNFELNPSVESDFTKYKIMNCLEAILEKSLYMEESELGQNPTETIKKVVEDYEKNRSKVLTLFDSHIKK